MAKKKEDKLDQSVVERIKIGAKRQFEVVDAINKIIRVRILLLLWAYNEQSVNDLCVKLGKSWPTVTRHLNVLEKVGLLNVREEKSRGPKNKKIYSVIPEILSLTRFEENFLRKITPEDAIEIFSHDLTSDAKIIDIFKKIFDDIIPYYGELGRILREMQDVSVSQMEDFYLKKRVNYYVEILNDEEFEFYIKRYNELLKDFITFRSERAKQDKSVESEKPFATIHMVLPIKKIQEARFKRFWKNKNKD
ncbi:MAG: ArsR family transcriptional regulator [Promethearchaeota archaeon]